MTNQKTSKTILFLSILLMLAPSVQAGGYKDTSKNSRPTKTPKTFLDFPGVKLDHDFRHGVFLGLAVSEHLEVDISGKHYGRGGTTFGAINASTEGHISDIYSAGYNFRYFPSLDLGFGLEVGFNYSRTNAPTQMSALLDGNGDPLIVPDLDKSGNPVFEPTGLAPPDPQIKLKTRELTNIESPSSYIDAADFYVGGLYEFGEFDLYAGNGWTLNVSPYIGGGHARTLGKWRRSFFSGIPNDPNYGKSGRTSVIGYYSSAKIGVHIFDHFSVEAEYAWHRMRAKSFRSFNIDGARAKYERLSVNIIYNF